jgi:predicted GIY-YIG superfamily endonuclease
MFVYLLHFSENYKHARHYLGCTDDLEERLTRHRQGRGARLVEVITEAGLEFQLARTWHGGFELERQLKRQKNSPRLCPICQSFAGKGEKTSPTLL